MTEPAHISTVLDSYSNEIKKQIFTPPVISRYLTGPSPITKENTMKNQIAEVRTEMKTKDIESLIEEYDDRVEGWNADPGFVVTWEVTFPDNDTVYHYAVIRGSNNRWYKTYSKEVFTTEQLVDEMVRLHIESETFLVR